MNKKSANNHPMYCVKCKSTTPSKNIQVIPTQNGRYRMAGVCGKCGSNKSKFISGQHAEGLLSGLLGFKDGFPFLNKIPIIGQLL